MITGYRREDQFVAKRYKNTEGHTLYKITTVLNDEIQLQHDRFSADNVMEEDYDE